MATTPFQPIAINVNFAGSQATVSAPTGTRVVGILGRAIKGPNVPFIGTAAQVYAAFGSPSDPLTNGTDIPFQTYLAASQSTGGDAAAQFLIMRAGVAPGTLKVYDVTGTTAAAVCFTLTAIGPYAGSAAANLDVILMISGVTAKVSSLTFIDAISGLPVLTLVDGNNGGLWDLSSNARIVAAIQAASPAANPASVVTATLGPSTNVPVAIPTPVPFAAGADGLGATAADPTIGGAGSTVGLLDQSLAYPLNYLATGFDAAAIAPTILSHLAAAQSVGAFRKAYLGAAAGTTFNTMTTTYLGAGLKNRRVSVVGHDSLLAYNPARQINDIVAGYHGGAAYAGLKASAPIAEAGIGQEVAGISDIVAPPDKSAILVSDTNLLAGSRLLTFEKVGYAGAVRVRDAQTTVPQYNANNQFNNDSVTNIPDQDDAFAAGILQAVQAVKGRSSSSATTIMLLNQYIHKFTAGYPITALAVSPNSQGGYDITASYGAGTIARGFNITVANANA